MTDGRTASGLAWPPRRVLVDTDVVLDVLLGRPSFVADSARVFDAVDRGRISGCVAGHAVTTAYYVSRGGQGDSAARDGVGRLLETFDVAPVGRAELAASLAGAFTDYEDGVAHEAAVASGCDAIVTRNVGDFAASALPVYTPAEMLAVLAGA